MEDDLREEKENFVTRAIAWLEKSEAGKLRENLEADLAKLKEKLRDLELKDSRSIDLKPGLNLEPRATADEPRGLEIICFEMLKIIRVVEESSWSNKPSASGVLARKTKALKKWQTILRFYILYAIINEDFNKIKLLYQILLEEYQKLGILDGTEVLNLKRIAILKNAKLLYRQEWKGENNFEKRSEFRLEMLVKIRHRIHRSPVQKFDAMGKSFERKFGGSRFPDAESRLWAVKLAVLRRELKDESQDETKRLSEIYRKAGKLSGYEKARIENQYQQQKQSAELSHATALCLSGGGIRSATFALGVLQGLAEHDLLDDFHYLSTVSGGGYIGSWLSALICRSKVKIRGSDAAQKCEEFSADYVNLSPE